MKQTILTLILCITTLTVTFAQEKQNDATWEETVEFILKYSKSLKSGKFKPPLNLKNFNVSNNKLSFKTDIKNEDDWDNTIDLSKLSDAKISEHHEDVIILSCTGPYVMWNPNDSDYEIKYRSYYSFEIGDNELRQRLLNAFKHLAKLATEKREAEREASGEKF